MATMHRKRQVELYKSIFLFTFFIYNIYFLWEKTSAWGHSNPATYVLKTEGDYRYGFGCKTALNKALGIEGDMWSPDIRLRLAGFGAAMTSLRNIYTGRCTSQLFCHL